MSSRDNNEARSPILARILELDFSCGGRMIQRCLEQIVA